MHEVVEVDAKTSQDGKVRAFTCSVDRAVYMEADYDHQPADVKAMLLALYDKGWRPVPEHEEEPELLDTGVRIRFRKVYVPHHRKVIPGLWSTPLLVGLGALAPTVDRHLTLMLGAVGA